MNPEIVKSYSKINLGLKILNKRPDNYHNIKSVFIEIDLFDIMEFKPSKTFNIQCDNKNVPINNQNTIAKAYSALNQHYELKNNFKISLYKSIPIESGLGGGSSNAATTLIALNKLNNLNLNKQELINIAKEIGSDVPFFIKGGIKLIKGTGDIIQDYPSPILNSLSFLLVFPKFSISTSWAYKKIKKTLHNHLDSDKFPALDEYVDWKLFDNDFEKVVGSAYPEIFEIKEVLLNNGALYSGLSGSGSTMFGIYNNKKFILESQNKLKNYNTLIASPT